MLLNGWNFGKIEKNNNFKEIGGNMIFNNIDSAYNYLMKRLENEGFKRKDERGDEVIQLPFVNLTFNNHIKNISNVLFVEIPKSTKLNNKMLVDYKNQILYGSDKDFIYTYQDRMCNHFTVNQYEYIINKLKKNPNSRRAVGVTWDVDIDTKTDEIPCWNYLCCSIYNNRLYMSVVFRSNDIDTAFVPNMYGLHSLHKMFCEQTGCEVGEFYYTAHNIHIIKNNL